MKTKKLLTACFCAAGLLALLLILTDHYPRLFSSVLAFPFEQIAHGLVLLAKTGTVGKGLAAALWLGLSAAPALYALRGKAAKETVAEKASLFILSATLLPALYAMANPLPFSPAFLQAFPDARGFACSLFGGTVWAVVILYAVLRLVRLFRLGSKEQLFRYMKGVLCALCIVFSALAALRLVGGIQSLAEPALTAADKIAGILLLLAELIPYILDILILLRLLELFDAAARGEEEGLLLAAKRVSDLCCTALGASAAIAAGSNILQLVLMRWLSVANIAVNIPVVSIAFALTALLLCRLLVENKELRDDNSLFI